MSADVPWPPAPGARIHAAGIGGVGMAGLAVLLQAAGFRVDGCDACENRLTERLRAGGIPVRHGHDAAHLDGADMLICTAALAPDHPERLAADAAQIPALARGEALARLTARPGTIAIAGTHGKTTTSAMLAWILHCAGRAPGFAVGGELPNFGGATARAGAGPDLVIEADESDGTLRHYQPGIAVITNIDFDHMEHFHNAAEFHGVFETFARAARVLWYGADHPAARRLGERMPAARGFGFDEAAALRTEAVSEDRTGQAFDVMLSGRRLGRVRIPLPGRHNALNALAAMGPALDRACPFDEMARALASFRPPRRRFDRVLEKDGVTVISDYAHHPVEIRALLDMARALKPGRIRAVFQPHRYTRTRALGADFPPAFDGVSDLVLAPVYAASEAPLKGGTTRDLLRRFPLGAPVRAADSLDSAWDMVCHDLRPGDLVLLIGAGDIEALADRARASDSPARGPAADAAG